MIKKVIVCGSRFGQFYIEALKDMENIEVIGLLANGSNRSVKCADHYNLKIFTSVESLPKDIDVACVAIGSSVFGGNGVKIAKELLKKRINVLFEQPIHVREISELYNTAISHNVKIKIGNLYNNLPAVRNFLLNVDRANMISHPSYLMVDLNTQLSYPVSGIIKQILKDTTVVNENYKYIEQKSCCNILSMNVNNVEVLVKAFNEIGKNNLDSDMRMLFSMVVGYPSGRLVLSSPLGPVFWEQSPNVPEIDLIPSFLEGDYRVGCNKPWISVLYQADEYNKSYIYRNIWVKAVKDDLKKFIFNEINEEQLSGIEIQHDLEIAVLWQKLMGSLGYPKTKLNDTTKYIDPYIFKRTEINCYSVKESINELNKISRDTMFYYLTKHISENSIPISILFNKIGISEKYKIIMERWILHLESFNYLEKKDDSIIIKSKRIDWNVLIGKWDLLESKWNTKAMPMNVFQYFRENARLLNDLLNSKVNANEILFSKGGDEIAKGLYSKTAIAIYLNELIVSNIKELLNEKNITILELGGGTASTTEKIVSNIEYDKYIFTDISPYFIEKAKDAFREYKGIEYGIINIDDDESYKQVGSKVDLIIAVGVLNNARNIENSLMYIKKILKDDGILMIVEAVDESPEILISQVFMMTEADDIRNEENITFLKMNQWIEMFKKLGFELLTFEPKNGDWLEDFNQKLFILKNNGGEDHGNRK